MKLCRVTENISCDQVCYIVNTRYIVDPHNNYSIRKSLCDMFALQHDRWKRPLMQTPKEYI